MIDTWISHGISDRLRCAAFKSIKGLRWALRPTRSCNTWASPPIDWAPLRLPFMALTLMVRAWWKRSNLDARVGTWDSRWHATSLTLIPHTICCWDNHGFTATPLSCPLFVRSWNTSMKLVKWERWLLRSILSCPLPKIWSIVMWQWPADTHEEWNFFHEYLRLSITSMVAHIYAYTTKHRDKSTYMKYRNINNIIHYIWIRQVKKRNWTHRSKAEPEYVLQSTFYTRFLI